MLRANFKATVIINGLSPGNSIHAILTNSYQLPSVSRLTDYISTVTMPTCDVLLRHFSKTMLYTVVYPFAYSYLLYALANIHEYIYDFGFVSRSNVILAHVKSNFSTCKASNKAL